VSGLLARLRATIVHNLGFKLLALAIAIGVQVMVHRDSVMTEDVPARLRLLGVPRGEIFVGSLPDMATLRLRGRRVALAELKALSNLEIPVDMSAYRNGDRLVLEPRHIETLLPVRAVEVARIEPAAFDVRLDRVVVRTLPVEVAVSGEAGPGFRANPRAATVDPPTVQVSGPAGLVNRLSAIRTAPIDLAWAEKDVSANARLAPPADRLVSVRPDEVKVTLRLEEIEMARTLTGVPLLVKGCPEDAQCSVDPPEIAVRVEGSGPAVRKLAARLPEGLAWVELTSALASPDGQVRVQTQLVRGVALTAMPAVAKFAAVRKAAAPESP